MITVIGLRGIPLIREGDDLGWIIVTAAEDQGVGIEDRMSSL